jgi:hypothetical protein
LLPPPLKNIRREQREGETQTGSRSREIQFADFIKSLSNSLSHVSGLTDLQNQPNNRETVSNKSTLSRESDRGGWRRVNKMSEKRRNLIDLESARALAFINAIETLEDDDNNSSEGDVPVVGQEEWSLGDDESWRKGRDGEGLHGVR